MFYGESGSIKRMSTNFSELWKKRSLIIALAFNDVKLRYKNSFLGFVWTFLEPLLMLAVLFFVFTNVIRSDIENYQLYLLLGLIIWYMFSRATTMGLSSLTDKSYIIQKIYLRKEILVISSCLTGFIMMIFELGAFAVFLVVFQFIPPITILLLPLILIELFVLSVGISFLLSVLNVYFRDIKFIWQVIVQAGFFLTPIIYRLDMFPETIRQILELNPVAHIIMAAHNVSLYGLLPAITSILYLIGTTAALFIVGYVVFRAKDAKIMEEL